MQVLQKCSRIGIMIVKFFTFFCSTTVRLTHLFIYIHTHIHVYINLIQCIDPMTR